MLRLFFGLNFKEHKILENKLNEAKSFFSDKNKIKWAKPEQLHITIFFIGEVNTHIAKEIIENCNNCFHDLKSFSIEYKRNLIFYNRYKPTIIGLEFKTNEAILQLKKSTDFYLEKFGFSAERRSYIPHITFGRVKEFQLLSEFKEYEKITTTETNIFNVNSFSLYKSTLTSSGSIYEALWQIKF